MSLGGYLKYMVMALNGEIEVTANSSLGECKNQMIYSTQIALASEHNDGLLRHVPVIKTVGRLLKYLRIH